MDVAEAISASFARSGIACDVAATKADGLHYLSVQRYDVAVFDINLPDGQGTEILRELRRRMDRMPVLILTAEFAIDDRVAALEDGADDYLVKPFDQRELEARVRALLRREQGRKTADLVYGALAYNPSAKTVLVAGRPVTMTRRELALFDILIRNKGRVMSKSRLYDGLFSFDDTDVGLNAIELYVARLRKKLAGSGTGIATMRGLGYKFDLDG